MADSKVRVFTVRAEPSREHLNPMSPEYVQHVLSQSGYRVSVEGGDHPCNCDGEH